jgi:formylglycine-generating enzyme required for sulfatase activity
VLRGGAWHSHHRLARVSSRSHVHPGGFGTTVGVRVVVGPDFPPYR